ncbi:MAG: primosomal protein N', partial [Alphaproteobacteria bacterium]|nr:primosomal protein N' [Alphaproteobacteria bacterium]
RGYAPLTICKNCGHRLSCPHCTAWLVEHKKTGKTQCHHCGFHAPLPKECPDCHEHDTWRACGPGVERISEEVSMLFPQARLMTLSSDHIESPKQIADALQKIKNNEVDIIIGTQILAKGHHFPDLTTVGIVDSDIAAAGELRSAEKAFQLLQQVAGRAGRAEKKGTVYAQSFAPETPVLEAFVKGDRDAFFEAELQERETAFMPPFSRLAAIIVADKDESALKKLCQELASKAPQSERVTILGPAPAMLYRLRGLYRMRFLIRADKRANINKLIRDWLDCVKIPSRTKVQIDIDPLSFY